MGMYNDTVIDKFGIEFTDKSLTHQNFKDSCDVNNLLKQYARTGDLELLNSRQAIAPGDYTNALDFQESMNLVASAQSQFNRLSAQNRDFFKNDVSAYLSFMNDDKNIVKAVEMGLIPGSVVKPTTDSVVPPTGNNTNGGVDSATVK